MNLSKHDQIDILLLNETLRGESAIDCLNRVIAEARKWREFWASINAASLTLDDDVNVIPASGVRATETSYEVDADGRLIPGTVREYVAPQPAPQNQGGPPLWPMIIRELGESELDRLLAVDMLRRHEFGVAKYGVPLVASNGRDHLADAYQEALDGVVYLRAAAINRFNCTYTYAAYSEMLELARRIRALIVSRDGK
jgi:hypothetical protein